jgi:hypothetical protein
MIHLIFYPIHLMFLNLILIYNYYYKKLSRTIRSTSFCCYVSNIIPYYYIISTSMTNTYLWWVISRFKVWTLIPYPYKAYGNEGYGKRGLTPRIIFIRIRIDTLTLNLTQIRTNIKNINGRKSRAARLFFLPLLYIETCYSTLWDTSLPYVIHMMLHPYKSIKLSCFPLLFQNT